MNNFIHSLFCICHKCNVQDRKEWNLIQIRNILYSEWQGIYIHHTRSRMFFFVWLVGWSSSWIDWFGFWSGSGWWWRNEILTMFLIKYFVFFFSNIWFMTEFSMKFNKKTCTLHVFLYLSLVAVCLINFILSSSIHSM